VRLLVAGNDPIVRKGFREIVRARPDWLVAAETASIDETLRCLRSAPFDVAILDVPLGASSGFDLVELLRAEFPALPLVVISTYPESHYAMAFLRAGANAFLRRDMEPAEILAAIATVIGGGRYVTAALAAEVARSVDGGGLKLPHERLSVREFEVFRLLATGKSPTEIARMLNLSVKTVSTYRTRILEKTGFQSNADIVGYAIRSKLI
jgi:DNA-binding NarL/FixJ family response regulator